MKASLFFISVGLFLVSCQPDPSENIKENQRLLNQDTLDSVSQESLDIQNLYNQVSLFIAGKKTTKFAQLQKKDYYKNYAETLNNSWKQTTSKNLSEISAWKEKNNLLLNDTLPVFYPFSGPDFLYANAFFEHSNTYIMVGLENPGKLPNLSKMSDGRISVYLYKLYHSLRYINQSGYFTTKQMQNDFTDSSMNGIIHLICFYLSRTDHHIGKISYVQIDNFGNEKEKKNFELENELINGIKILFFSNKSNSYKTIYYFPLDLSDINLQDHLGFVMFINNVGLKNTFLKSASYLLHEKEFSLLQDLILKQSNIILQDDSGISYENLKNADFSLKLFGNYNRTIGIFKKYYQENLHKALHDEQAPELPFKLGYNSWQNEMVLILATKGKGNAAKPITYMTEKEGVVFKVQIKSSWKKIDADASIFKGLPKVDYYFTDNLYKYTIGNFSSPESCGEYQKLANRKGFKDAFIVAFYKKNRISLEEAEKIMAEY
jgi:hypothetical protein